MLEVPLAKGRGAMLIDEEDEELVSGYRWRLLVDPYNLYAIGRLQRTSGPTVKAHRVIMGVFDPHIFVDHRDGNGLNNQRSNLRLATRSQNMRNRAGAARGSTSPYLGVSWKRFASGRGAWQAQIKSNGKVLWLGSFAEQEDAARAYDSAAKDAHGEFAKLNFPEELS